MRSFWNRKKLEWKIVAWKNISSKKVRMRDCSQTYGIGRGSGTGTGTYFFPLIMWIKGISSSSSLIFFLSWRRLILDSLGPMVIMRRTMTIINNFMIGLIEEWNFEKGENFLLIIDQDSLSFERRPRHGRVQRCLFNHERWTCKWTSGSKNLLIKEPRTESESWDN